MHVIPALNVTTREEAERELEKISGFAHWIHIDVVDGKFAPNVTWGDPEELRELLNKNPHLKTVHVEAHLMVQDPEKAVSAWAKVADRIIVHVEAIKNKGVILKIGHDHGVEVMLSIALKTPTAKLEPHLTHFKFFQVLAVTPGKAGQRFDSSAEERIKFLRAHVPDAIIEVDGGMNPSTAAICRDAGAHIIVAASYILGSEDPKVAYEELRRVMTK